jgi:OCT family organic cation transporter-like MFS transporter 4/5
MAVGREKEALRILEGAARRNGREVTAIKEHVQRLRPDRESQNSDKKATLADLMRTPNLRRSTLVLFVRWFLAGLTFYGFSQSLSKVAGNVFITTVIAGETENLVCSVVETRQYEVRQ